MSPNDDLKGRDAAPSATDKPVSGQGSLIQQTLARGRRLLTDLKNNEGGRAMDWRTLFILLIIPVLLTIFYYFGRPDFFRRNYWEWGLETFGGDWPYQGILPYGYWAAASLVLRVVIPILIIVLILRHSPRDYGFKIVGLMRHVPIYAGLLLIMLPLLYLASTQENFQYSFMDDE